MKRISFFLSVLFLLVCGQATKAQGEMPFAQFWTARTYYNPSFAGETEKIRLSGIYRYEWSRLQNAPQRVFLSADMPMEFLGMQHGIAVLTHAHSVGNKRNNLFAIQYAYKYLMGKGALNIGIQAGMQQMNFDPASLRIITDSTQNNRKTVAFNGTEKNVPIFNAGVSWTSQELFIGAAAININAPRFYAAGDSVASSPLLNDSTLSRLPLSYNFSAGYNIRLLNSLIQIQPMIFVQTDLKKTQLQTAFRMIYDEKYSLGASWRSRQGYSFFAGVVVQDIGISYAYDLHTSGIGKESGGSHEIAFSYRLSFDLFNKKPQPHKSVRLL